MARVGKVSRSEKALKKLRERTVYVGSWAPWTRVDPNWTLADIANELRRGADLLDRMHAHGVESELYENDISVTLTTRDPAVAALYDLDDDAEVDDDE